jgi:hypothetical protein
LVSEVGCLDCIGFSATEKMEDMEFLKAMLAEMNAKMDVARKTNRDEMKQEIRAGQEHI